MKSVFVVTSGEYSDYSIRGVFSTEKSAHDYMEHCKAHLDTCPHAREFNSVVEYMLDEPLLEKEYMRHSASIFVDDGALVEPQMKWTLWGKPESTQYVCENVPIHKGRSVACSFSHKSAKHALKLAAEARQEFLRKNANSKTASKL